MDLFTIENFLALLTLTCLEIILGIDNIVFLVIIVSKVEKEKRKKARALGLSLALMMRILLLLTIGWVMKLQEPLFSVFSQAFSGRDLIMFTGGLFLIGKATHEMHNKIEQASVSQPVSGRLPVSFIAVLIQIMLVDVVFSIDSVITAVGMAESLAVMITAVVIAIGIMIAFAEKIEGFIERYPTLKVLALSFILLIGVMLVADGFGRHIEKAYIYFAMGFSLFVEMINIRVSRKDAILEERD